MLLKKKCVPRFSFQRPWLVRLANSQHIKVKKNPEGLHNKTFLQRFYKLCCNACNLVCLSLSESEGKEIGLFFRIKYPLASFRSLSFVQKDQNLCQILSKPLMKLYCWVQIYFFNLTFQSTFNFVPFQFIWGQNELEFTPVQTRRCLFQTIPPKFNVFVSKGGD